MPIVTATIDRGEGPEDVPVMITPTLFHRIQRDFVHTNTFMSTHQQPMPWPPPESTRERFDTEEGKSTWDEFIKKLGQAIGDKDIGYVPDPAEHRDHEPRRYAQLLKGLHETQQYERTLRQYRERTIREARRAGAPWSEIGDALGVTRQSAFERYRHVDVFPPEELKRLYRWPTESEDNHMTHSDVLLAGSTHAEVLADASKKWGEAITKAFFPNNTADAVQCLITGKHLELVEGKCPRCGKYDLED